MKKIISLFLSGILIFTLVSCSQEKQNKMSIKPSNFSNETNEILELINDQINFFDISFDKSAKYQKISAWIIKNGEWIEIGNNISEVNTPKERIGIRLMNDNFDIFTFSDKHNKGKYTYSTKSKITNIDTPMNFKISENTHIELNKETTLLLKISSNKNNSIDITKDFRKIDSDEGIAITLIVSDKNFSNN